jgi:hypothetical protein
VRGEGGEGGRGGEGGGRERRAGDTDGGKEGGETRIAGETWRADGIRARRC